MTGFDWIILFIGAPWAVFNLLLLALALFDSRVAGFEPRPMFFAPFVLLLIYAYRVLG